MAYLITPYVYDGDSWTASQHNTYIRDNFTALWPFTAAGDMVYANSSSLLTLVPIDDDAQILNVKNNVPSWYYRRQLNCCVSNSGTSISNVTWTNLDFDTIENNDLSMFSLDSSDTITIKKSGYYLINGYVLWEINYDETREVRIIYASGYDYVDTLVTTATAGNISNTFNYMRYFSANDTIKLAVYQGSGSTLSAEGKISVTYWGS